PPLRERKDDVMLLANAFVTSFNRELNREEPVKGFSPEATALMMRWSWRVTVRELENAIERSVLLAEGELVIPENLPEKLWGAPDVAAPVSPSASGAPPLP